MLFADPRGHTLPMDPLFVWPKGSRWTFDADYSGEKRLVTLTVVAAADGRTDLEYDIREAGGSRPRASADEAWYDEGEYVVWGARDADDVLSPYWRVLKKGAGKGDTWPGLLPKEVTAHMGAAEIVVPAGTFQDAVHIRVMGPKIHDFHFAPGVGLVRWDTGTESGEVSLQLRAFSKG